MNKETKKYFSEVRKNIYGKSEQKKVFLNTLKDNLLDFEEQNINADYENICENFGTPDVLINEFMSGLGTGNLKKAFQWKKIIVFAAVAVILMFGTYLLANFIDDMNHGFTVEERPVYIDESSREYVLDEKGETIFIET